MAHPFDRPAVPLFRYQIDWLLDKRRFKIGMFARQTGKTFTTTLEIVDDCYEAEANGGRTKWVILSRGERQAKEAIDTAKLHAAAYGMAIEEIEGEWAAENGNTYKSLEIVFPGGSRIMALPANADTARGFSANVFLDEFAFHQDSRAIWKALFPVISAGWKLRVTSTPNGKNNKFFELMTAEDATWSRHVVDIHRAVADGLPRNIDELRSGLADEDAWSQEFELQWLDEASAWLPYELIGSVEHEDAGKPELYQGNPCFIGNDIARKKHLWVCAALEPVGDVLWLRELVTLRNATFATQDEVFDRMMAQYRAARACMDQTGMGEKPVEDAQRRHGSLRVEGVMFTGPNKLTLATAGKERFEDRGIRIPMGDPELRADLHKLKKIASETGAPRFVADDSDGKGHADRAWAIFLGVHAAGGPVAEYHGYQAAKRDGARDRMKPPSDDDAGGRLADLQGAW